MPEGPEVRRIADRLAKVLTPAPLETVWFAFAELKPFEKHLVGQRVIRVDSWGKALLMTFEEGDVLYSHNQLYGRWAVGRLHAPPSLSRSLRVSLATDRHVAQLYSASDITLWHRDTLHDHPFLSKLGPDILTHGVTVPQILERFEQPRFVRRRLGGLLLDQGFLAGIGNYLRSEILFFAGLMPEWKVIDLSPVARERLAKVILDVTQRAWRWAGVTNIEGWREPLQAAGLRRAQWRHAVFNRAGEPCHACGTLIERKEVTSRRLYYCPHCQR